ncbi:MAG: DUF1553 domain-containing protein [Opitutaceae bacterium]|nr:DUF1553 domain-containing protein [Opitutaceae bacterium]
MPRLPFAALSVLLGGTVAASPADGSRIDSTPAPVAPFEVAAPAVPRHPVDVLVAARLSALGLTPAPRSSDAVFVRRVFLDVIGTLPTAAEARQFLQERGADKRRVLIDRLLEREEFADYWAMKWSDLLRIKAEFPVNLWPNAAQAYHRWVRTAMRDNLPFDRFARELLTASGSNFRVGPVNFYRTTGSREPEAITASVALAFMGSRTERWTPEQRSALAMCFRYVGFKPTGEWKEEIVFFDPEKFPAGGRAAAVFPDGAVAHLTRERDPREDFADWLLAPSNPWFTRAIANRVWSWLLGRGIVHEPDDLRPDNPPSNPALLARLERELVASRYDVKALMRFILNSETYQRSALATTDRPEAAVHFAHYPLRRLEAEVLIDALNQITGTSEKYSSAIPEPFTFIPEQARAIALPDGSITSSFLEAFGRPARDTGLERERNNAISAPQRLHLLNSTHVQRKLEQGPKLQALLRARSTPRELVDNLYFTILSRPATAGEHQLAADYATTTGDRRTAALDLAWALINSAEFLHRH